MAADEIKKRPEAQFLERDSMYREKWQALVKSRLYLAFIISLIIGGVFISLKGSYEVYSVIRTMGEALEGLLQTGLEFSEITELLLPEVLKLMIIGLVTTVLDVLLVGLWLIRGKNGSAGKGRTIGIGMVFWTYAALLALAVCAFVITLPMFTEWLPYEQIQGLPMQIIYCVYAFVILYCALVLSVVKKMWDNLNFWEGSRGPLVALAVINMLLAIIMGIAVCLNSFWDVSFIVIGVAAMVHLVFAVILLFKYRKLMLSM